MPMPCDDEVPEIANPICQGIKNFYGEYIEMHLILQLSPVLREAVKFHFKNLP